MNKFKYKKPEFNYVKNDLIKLLRKVHYQKYQVNQIMIYNNNKNNIKI